MDSKKAVAKGVAGVEKLESVKDENLDDMMVR